MSFGDQDREVKSTAVHNPRLDAALQSLGKILNIFSVYGENHPAARVALEESYASFKRLFEECAAISLGATHGVLTVDGRPVAVKGVLKKGLEKRLVNLNITGLKIRGGISFSEFKQLIYMLNQGEESSFKKALSESGLAHVGSEETTYQAVRADEKVVSNGSGSSKLAGMGDEIAAYFEAQQQAACAGVQVDQIVAFLKGDVGESKQVMADVADVANDPNKLAELIMESTAVRQSTSTLEGETLADVVLGCLRKTYDSLKIQPGNQGEKGPENIKKAMLLLERSILDRMRSYFGATDPAKDAGIKRALRSMNEDMELELVAASFMDQRDAVRKSTDKIVRYIKDRGEVEASEHLKGADFTPVEWRKLVVQSKRTGSGRGSGSGEGDSEFSLSANLGTLGMVLEKLEALMRTDNPADRVVTQLVDAAQAQLSSMTETTEKKIVSLTDYLKDDEPDATTIEGTARSMRASDLLAALAEIAQELAQPLTVINTSLEMVIHGYVGAVTDEQKGLLKLATGSGEHMHYLMDQLQNIVGFPTNLGVDKRFAGTLNDFVELLPPAPESSSSC